MQESTVREQSRWQGTLRRVTGVVPPARWPLLLGAVLALPLAFWPWVRVGICAHILCTGYNVWQTITINPLVFDLESSINAHPTLARLHPFIGVLLVVFVASGVIGSLWVHGPIRTRGQHVGAVVLTLWSGALAWAGIVTIAQLRAGVLYPNMEGFFVNWSLTWGGYLFIAAVALLGIGLALLWRDIWRSRMTVATTLMPFTVQRLAPRAYLATLLAAVGLVIWFTGYYGYYWLLAAGCPAAPPFASPICERISAQGGYFHLFGTHAGDALVAFTYWLIGTVLVCSGVALLFILGTRRTTRVQTIVYAVWLGAIALFSLISFIGIRLFAASTVGDVLTDGPAVTLLGLALLLSGGLLRLVAMRTPAAATR